MILHRCGAIASAVALLVGVAPAAALAQEVGEDPCAYDPSDPACQDDGGTSTGAEDEVQEPAPSPSPSPSPKPPPKPSPSPSPSPAPAPAPADGDTDTSTTTDSSDGGSGGGSTASHADGPTGRTPASGDTSTSTSTGSTGSADSTSDDGGSASRSWVRVAPPQWYGTISLPEPMDLGSFTAPEFPAAQVAPPREPTEVPTPHGTRQTLPIIQAAGLVDGPTQRISDLLSPFPIAGEASYRETSSGRSVADAWLADATMISSPAGTPVVAPDTGMVTDLRLDDPVVGNAIELTVASGSTYVLAGLGSIAGSVSVGDTVRRGVVIGAVGSPPGGFGGPHVLFAIDVDGQAVSPVPHLDRWLTQAASRAQAMAVAVVTGSIAAETTAVLARSGQPAGYGVPAGARTGPDAPLPVWWPLPLLLAGWVLSRRRSDRRTARIAAVRTLA